MKWVFWCGGIILGILAQATAAFAIVDVTVRSATTGTTTVVRSHQSSIDFRVNVPSGPLPPLIVNFPNGVPRGSFVEFASGPEIPGNERPKDPCSSLAQTPSPDPGWAGAVRESLEALEDAPPPALQAQLPAVATDALDVAAMVRRALEKRLEAIAQALGSTGLLSEPSLERVRTGNPAGEDETVPRPLLACTIRPLVPEPFR